jgi:hypothetical protein
MSTERASGQAGESGLEPVIGFVSRVLVPGGLLTAVLYYFGYVREQALFSHFGIDLGIVGFATTDYLVQEALLCRPAGHPTAGATTSSHGLEGFGDRLSTV